MSEQCRDLVGNCKITPGYRSDHAIIELNLTRNRFKRGPDLWKFNRDLLKKPDYIEQVNETIHNFLRYALPIYKLEFINERNAQDLQFSISDDLLLEMLLMEFRNVTIKFSSSLKRATISKEKQLIKSIESLENENPTEKGLHELEKK